MNWVIPVDCSELSLLNCGMHCGWTRTAVVSSLIETICLQPISNWMRKKKTLKTIKSTISTTSNMWIMFGYFMVTENHMCIVADSHVWVSKIFNALLKFSCLLISAFDGQLLISDTNFHHQAIKCIKSRSWPPYILYWRILWTRSEERIHQSTIWLHYVDIG